MPTLNRRSDGGYFVRHFYRDHSTWQITGEGVRYLERRRILEDMKFSTDLFVDLWVRRHVFYGQDTPPAPVAVPDSALEAEVRERARALHTALRAGAVDSALAFVSPFAEDLRLRLERDAARLTGQKWIIVDVRTMDLSAGLSASFGSRHAAFVNVRIGEEKESEQIWFDPEEKWLRFT